MRSVLMVAFHFPPWRGSSGIHRTLRFCQYLPEFGWRPLVLTAHPRAYPERGDDLVAPRGVVVVRAAAYDTARHLAVRGAYPWVAALPDRWVSWWPGGVLSGLRMVRRFRPDVIWSTFPIATAHLIGLSLQRLTGLPWVADFRDPMTEDDYPREVVVRRSYRWIERQVVARASRLVFTARSAIQTYTRRYPTLAPERVLLIPNGYDDEDFNGLAVTGGIATPAHAAIRLVHAGLLYPEERDPRPFFRALARLRDGGLLERSSVRIDLIAPGSNAYYTEILRDLRLHEMVSLQPALPHRCALRACADADGLLLFQGAWCNHQIPAKAYEYLRLRRPILALTSRDGDTAALLEETGGATVVEMADEEALARAIPLFLEAVRKGAHPLPDPARVKRYSRRAQSHDLALGLGGVAVVGEDAR